MINTAISSHSLKDNHVYESPTLVDIQTSSWMKVLGEHPIDLGKGDGIEDHVVINNSRTLEVVITEDGKHTTLRNQLGECDKLPDFILNSYFLGDFTDYSDMINKALTVQGLNVYIVENDGNLYICTQNEDEDKYANWDLCTAYVRLGYLPPIQFIFRLPTLENNDDHLKYSITKAALIVLADDAINRLKQAKLNLDRSDS